MPDANTAATATVTDRSSRLARLRMSSFGLITMLILEFVLGIIYNLYGTAPTSTKSIGLFSSPAIALHVILGILLFVAAVAQLARSIGTRHRLTIWMSVIGLVGILGAGFAGMGFASSGAAGASLGMSLAFAVSLAAYIVLVFALPSSSTT